MWQRKQRVCFKSVLTLSAAPSAASQLHDRLTCDSPRVGVLGLLDTAPTLRRGTVILPADDDTCKEGKHQFRDIKPKRKKTQSEEFHLLLYRLESVVGSRQTVAVWRESRSGVRFDQRQRSHVLLPRYLQQELNTAGFKSI